jgi:hypothetical protein
LKKKLSITIMESALNVMAVVHLLAPGRSCVRLAEALVKWPPIKALLALEEHVHPVADQV